MKIRYVLVSILGMSLLMGGCAQPPADQIMPPNRRSKMPSKTARPPTRPTTMRRWKDYWQR